MAGSDSLPADLSNTGHQHKSQGVELDLTSGGAVHSGIPRPSKTGPLAFIIVPMADGKQVGHPSGDLGLYRVEASLGVPGFEMLFHDIDPSGALAAGDSLILTDPFIIDQLPHSDAGGVEFFINTNTHGRVAQVSTTLQANSFNEAEERFHNLVMPLLSLLAFKCDSALDIRSMLITEETTQIQEFHTIIAGEPSPIAPIDGPMTRELIPFLASYREGLNLNSPGHQALAFSKVVEGITSLRKRRGRQANAASKASQILEVNDLRLPLSLDDLLDQSEFVRACFLPYLGQTFGEMRDRYREPIRNAVAHISPGKAVVVADTYRDVQICRSAVPILRYMARVLIDDEIERLSPRPATA